MGYLKAIAWISLSIALAWMIYKPGFDSGSALAGAILAVGGLYFAGKKRKEASHRSQSQSVSSHGIGIQAGRDIKLGESSERKQR